MNMALSGKERVVVYGGFERIGIRPYLLDYYFVIAYHFNLEGRDGTTT